MTMKDLIQELEKLDQDKQVRVMVEGDGHNELFQPAPDLIVFNSEYDYEGILKPGDEYYSL